MNILANHILQGLFDLCSKTIGIQELEIQFKEQPCFSFSILNWFFSDIFVYWWWKQWFPTFFAHDPPDYL